jgi:hypothetical protein
LDSRLIVCAADTANPAGSSLGFSYRVLAGIHSKQHGFSLRMTNGGKRRPVTLAATDFSATGFVIEQISKDDTPIVPLERYARCMALMFHTSTNF